MRIPKQIQKTLHLLWALPLLFILSAPQTYAAGGKILPSGGTAGDEFGGSVSISGDYAIVGANNDGDNGANSGSAYVFYNGGSGWVQQKKLVSSDIAESDNFGGSVSIFGDYAIVGALRNSSTGSAYIFYKDEGGIDNWGEVTKITASDGAEGDYFGASVSISGDYVVVGATEDSDNGNSSGSAYVYYKDEGGADNWGEVTKITASDGAEGDYFGASVSISGINAIVGASGNDDNGTSSGSAYIFSRDEGGADNWGQVKKLLASDGAEGDIFGYSVSISVAYVIAGARDNDENGIDSGAAYVFYKDPVLGWTEQKKLMAIDGAASDEFGWSVSISGTNAISGAVYNDDNGNDSGSAYIFPKDEGGVDNWGQLNEVIASDGTGFDGLGYSVSISGDIAIAGAPTDDDNGSNSGSAYIFYKGGKSWVEQKKLTASDGEVDDNFGLSVAIYGDYAVVGAAHSSLNAGSAYIFYKDEGGADNWGQVKKLTAGLDAAADDTFGISVAISGDYVIVSAEGDDDNGDFSGSAYIFARNQGGADNWGQVQKLLAADGAAGDQFGYSASIDGNYAIVSAPCNDDNGADSGSAYIFAKDQGGVDNWGQVKKLLASDGAADDNLGSVSISGNYAVVGSSGHNTATGSAYIFSKDEGGVGNWGEVEELLASDGAEYDAFGNSVSINGDYVSVGAPGDDDNGDWTGSAYMFYKDEGGADNWGEVEKIIASDGAEGDDFGVSVGIGSSHYIIGADGDDDNGVDSGAAYIYDYEPAGGGGGGGCGDPGNPDDAGVCIAGEVDAGVAITAGDNVTLEVDPANLVISDDTVTHVMGGTSIGNILHVWNNNDDGFNVTVTLAGGDTGTTADTLGIATTATTLFGETGTIKFMSTEDGGLLSGGTDVAAFTAYSGSTAVYSIVDVVTNGAITVDHELGASTAVLPGTYTGTATYTIAVGV